MKKLKIAMLASNFIRIPPIKRFLKQGRVGATESVVYAISEELIKRGHDVTLFATKDSITKAKHHAVCLKGYEEDKRINPEVWKLLHISEVFERADEFDIIHNHFDYSPLTYSKLVETPIVTTLHGFPSEIGRAHV